MTICGQGDELKEVSNIWFDHPQLSFIHFWSEIRLKQWLPVCFPSASSHNQRRRTLVPITPMPHYSDMDTPELKNKLNRSVSSLSSPWPRHQLYTLSCPITSHAVTVILDCLALFSISGCFPPVHLFLSLSSLLSPLCRFGVRPLPKRQMILKLKEIHQYTHQLVSSDSEDEAPSACRTAQMKPPSSSSVAKFKEPRAPAATSPLKHNREEEAEPLSASQGSNTSSTAASEESERCHVCSSVRIPSGGTAHFSHCTFVLSLYMFSEDHHQTSCHTAAQSVLSYQCGLLILWNTCRNKRCKIYRGIKDVEGSILNSSVLGKLNVYTHRPEIHWCTNSTYIPALMCGEMSGR